MRSLGTPAAPSRRVSCAAASPPSPLIKTCSAGTVVSSSRSGGRLHATARPAACQACSTHSSAAARAPFNKTVNRRVCHCVEQLRPFSLRPSLAQRHQHSRANLRMVSLQPAPCLSCLPTVRTKQPYICDACSCTPNPSPASPSSPLPGGVRCRQAPPSGRPRLQTPHAPAAARRWPPPRCRPPPPRGTADARAPAGPRRGV